MLFLTLFLWSCGHDVETNTGMIHLPTGSAAEVSEALPLLYFESDTFRFGNILEGTVVNHTFHFENKGEGPLLISAVESTCGCTVLRGWPQQAIMPGEQGEISASFDSNLWPGEQTKELTIISNTIPSAYRLYFTGMVIGPNSTKP